MERFRETYDRVTSVIYVHKYITHTQCITTTVSDYAYTHMCVLEFLPQFVFYSRPLCLVLRYRDIFVQRTVLN